MAGFTPKQYSLFPSEVLGQLSPTKVWLDWGWLYPHSSTIKYKHLDHHSTACMEMLSDAHSILVQEAPLWSAYTYGLSFMCVLYHNDWILYN